MVFTKLLATAGLIASFAISSVVSASLPTISTVGSKFYDSDGNQFFVKGVAYQLTEDDPLIDTNQCTRDASLMKILGTNTIRVYHVDPTADHTGCMAAFADAGIYIFVDLDTFTTAIDPKTGAKWTSDQYDAFGRVMDAFANFDNTLGFFVGNEVISLANQSNAAPYVKAATRDMKAYRDEKSYRKIPIGYCAADIADLRPMLQNYLACGGNSSENIDFFGLNAYEWCGPVDFMTSGYSVLNQQATGYPLPIFFSETGCNTNRPRDFADQAAIFGPDMVDQWSGAIIYEWIQEENTYGLISYGPTLAPTATGSGIVGGFSRVGTPTPVQPDFSNLQAQWKTLTPTGTPSSEYTPNITPPVCPSSTAGGWLVNGNERLPSLGQALVTSATAATGTASTTPTGTGTETGSSTSATSTKGSASGGKQIAGMSAGLVAVMMGFMYWL